MISLGSMLLLQLSPTGTGKFKFPVRRLDCLSMAASCKLSHDGKLDLPGMSARIIPWSMMQLL